MKTFFSKFEILIVILVFCMYSCIETSINLDNSFKTISGKGPIVTKSLNLNEFNSIDFNGLKNIYISQGEVQEVKVVGQQNIIDNLRTKIINETCVFEFEKGNYKNYECTIYVTIPNLKKVNLSGVGDVFIKSFKNQKTIDLTLYGVGDINFETFFNLEKLSVDLNGVGDVVCTKFDGILPDLSVKLRGTGDFKGFKMKTNKTTINHSGVGDCELNVTQELIGNLSGVGDIKYSGEPKLSFL